MEERTPRLEVAQVGSRSPRWFGLQAKATADEFGWAKTYCTEYVALARLFGCLLVTLDARLGGDRCQPCLL